VTMASVSHWLHCSYHECVWRVPQLDLYDWTWRTEFWNILWNRFRPIAHAVSVTLHQINPAVVATSQSGELNFMKPFTSQWITGLIVDVNIWELANISREIRSLGI
jgi:hypothetical protein